MASKNHAMESQEQGGPKDIHLYGISEMREKQKSPLLLPGQKKGRRGNTGGKDSLAAQDLGEGGKTTFIKHRKSVMGLTTS